MATQLETTEKTPHPTATVGSTMKAIVQEGTGSADALHLREVEKPPVDDDRVLIRVRAASVNALDWHTVHGGFLLNVISKLMRSKDYPIRGVDLAGVVEAVGKDVTGLRPGDEVFGTGRGAFAEWSSSLERGLVRKPKDLSFTQAATVGVAATTALQGLRDHGHLASGQRVLIHGAGGGVGTFAVQIAKVLGAHVTAVTGPKNVDLVSALGPDVVVDYSREDITKRGQRYDVIYDVAATRPIGAMRRLLTPTGIFVQCGASKSGWFAVFGRIIALVVRQRLFKQRVVMYIAKTNQADLTYLSELIVAGTVRPAIDRTYPLTEGVEAVRYLGTGQARAKVVITMS
ncbi:MAG TPA: NAD(P)-dependent alcohol dehydrogenase [Candidatus Limnocylindria bacterium]|jgi:NADPH:quinone reductase-like Zn-dependent oxidoreductase